jgi:hypothetical protein
MIKLIAPRPDAPVPDDWYDGKPKLCPGSPSAPAGGAWPDTVHSGSVTEDGEVMYLLRCRWCNAKMSPGPMPDHVFIPVRVEDIRYVTGKCLYGIEPGTPGFSKPEEE